LIGDVAKQVGCADRYVSQMFRLGFLAPDIVCAILEGCEPVDLTLDRLAEGIPFSLGRAAPALWVRRSITVRLSGVEFGSLDAVLGPSGQFTRCGKSNSPREEVLTSPNLRISQPKCYLRAAPPRRITVRARP
jgi:hypothetical protein